MPAAIAKTVYGGDAAGVRAPSRTRSDGWSGPGRRGPAVRGNGGAPELTREEFEELVAEALDRIPPELTRLMNDAAVFVEDEPDPGDPELLGLYEGTPLTERGEWYAGVLPGRITIYRGPTLQMCESREDVVVETESTGVRDIPSYASWDEDPLFR